MKTAIIFAAGIGTRLKPFTAKINKSLIVFHGLPLIEHTIQKLLTVPQLAKIIIVTGYLHQDFIYLTTKYHNVTLIKNQYYEIYHSAYALKLVASAFDGNNDLFLIAGDMISTKNHFLNPFVTNVMVAIKREKNNHKADWSYQLDDNNNIIDIIKTNNPTSLLAGEWSYLTKEWAKILAKELNNPQQELVLQTTMVGKYLISNSKLHHITLKPYLLNYDEHWDLDNEIDYLRTKSYFK